MEVRSHELANPPSDSNILDQLCFERAGEICNGGHRLRHRAGNGESLYIPADGSPAR